MQSGYVVSDLHLFSGHSAYERHCDALMNALSFSDVFVFNGDIFDIGWSTLGSVEAASDNAVSWLRGILSCNPGVEIHYVAGNHDCHPVFYQALDILSSENSLFKWHPFLARLGQNVFLHGDVAYCSGDALKLNLYRSLFIRSAAGGAITGALYRFFVNTRLPGLISRLYSTHETVCKIHYYLEYACLGGLAGVKNVYFGHTHAPFSSYSYQGVSYFNSGSMVKGQSFKLLPFKVSKSLPASQSGLICQPVYTAALAG